MNSHFLEERSIQSIFSNKVQFDLFQRLVINWRNLINISSIFILLKMTFRKLLTINNMLHIVDIRNNFMFESIVSNNRFKMILNNDIFIFNKSGIFIGK